MSSGPAQAHLSKALAHVLTHETAEAIHATSAALDALYDELGAPLEFDFQAPYQGEVPREHLLLRLPPTSQDVPELGERLSVPVIDGGELQRLTAVVAAMQEREVSGVKVLLVALEPDRESEPEPQSGVAAVN